MIWSERTILFRSMLTDKLLMGILRAGALMAALVAADPDFLMHDPVALSALSIGASDRCVVASAGRRL